MRELIYEQNHSMSTKNINITVNLREIESFGQNDKLTIRIMFKKQKIPQTPKDMLEKFKLSNEIGSMLKPCW